MISDNVLISDKLDTLFSQTVKKLPGKQLISSVQRGDGSFRWIQASGLAADSSPIYAQTPFFIASIDKLITATLILQLWEQGFLKLDSPAAEYLPSDLIHGLHVFKGKDYSSAITVRHLLTHTSGLADWYEDFPKSGENLVESILNEGDRDLSLSEMMDYVRTRLQPNFAPQDIQSFLKSTEKYDGKSSASKPVKIKTRYTDTGFMLLTAILSEVTGQPLEKLHHEKVYNPLGMTQTWLIGRSQPRKSVPTPFPLVARETHISIPKILRSVWGVYSTCDDMVCFLKALYSGKLFKKMETLKLMTEGFHRFGFPTDKASIRLPGWPIAYSHGNMHFKLPRLFSPFKPMPELIGHTGSTGCWLFYAPDLDLYFTGAADDLTAGALPFRYVPNVVRIMNG